MSSIFKVSILATMLLALISYFFLDKSIANYFANNHNLKDIFSFITNFGLSEIYLIPSAVIFLIFLKFNKRVSNSALYIFLSVAISGILSIVIKMIFARYRPPMLLGNEHLYGFSWFDFGYLVNSFPSGHSTTAFSAFIGFSLLFPKFKWLFYLFATLIAVSRVVLDVHFLSDILIGALLGTLTSYYLYYNYFKGKI